MKRSECFVLFVLAVFLISSVSAANLNLKLAGTINTYSSDVYLKTSSSAVSGFDSYDMITPTSPDNYSQFYSTSTGSNLAVDSWDGSTRTINLTYHLTVAQTGTFSMSWASLSGTDYDANLIVYGDDSSRTTALQTVNMRSISSVTTSMVGDTDLYFTVVVSGYTAPITPVTPGGGDTGGGGGGGGATTGIVGIEEDSINVQMAINTIRTKQFTIENTLTTSARISIAVEGISDIVSIKENLFTLNAGESKTINIRISAPELPGIYVGKILVNGQVIPISVSVSTKELLFDVGVVIPDNHKKIRVGDKLESQITLIPMGEDPRLDITIEYTIRDFDGRVFLTESETMLVEGQKTFKKSFATQNLPEGNYVLGVELTYINGVAVSSSNFEIRGKSTIFSRYTTIIFGLVVAILIVAGATAFVLHRNRTIKKSIRRK